MPIHDEQARDERLILRDRGVGRDIGRNPLFDPHPPTTRTGQRRAQTDTMRAVGGFGQRTESVTSYSATPVAFQLIPGRQDIVNGAGAFHGITAYYDEAPINDALFPTPDTWSALYGTTGAGTYTVGTNNRGIKYGTVEWTAAPTGGARGIQTVPTNPSLNSMPVVPGDLINVSVLLGAVGSTQANIVADYYVAGAWNSSKANLVTVGGTPNNLAAVSTSFVVPAGIDKVLIRFDPATTPAVGSTLTAANLTIIKGIIPSPTSIQLLVTSGNVPLGSLSLSAGIPASLVLPMGVNINGLTVETVISGTPAFNRSNCAVWVATVE